LMLRFCEPASHDRTAATTDASSCGQVHRPRSRRRLPRTGNRHRLDVKLKKLAAQLQRGLGNLLIVSIGPDGDADVKRRWSLFHSHTPYPRGDSTPGTRAHDHKGRAKTEGSTKLSSNSRVFRAYEPSHAQAEHRRARAPLLGSTEWQICAGTTTEALHIPRAPIVGSARRRGEH
jgi:hypothetical protein